MTSDTQALARRLVDLAHAADELVERGAIVDSYFGSYQPRITKHQPRRASDISSELLALAGEAKAEQTDQWVSDLYDIEATARAIGTFLRAHEDPNAMPYQDIVAIVLDTPLIEPADSELASLRDQLADVLEELEMKGRWPISLQEWRQSTTVSAGLYLSLLEQNANRFKKRLLDDVIRYLIRDQGEGGELVKASLVDYRLADTSATWSAYHSYEGRYRSLIEVNQKQEFERDTAGVFAAHEVFPGHHAQAIIREFLYRHHKLGLQATLSLINSPGNVLAEGIGDFARYLLQPPLDLNEQAAHLADRLFTSWRHRLGVAYHKGELSLDDASYELQEQMGIASDRARRAMQFAAKWKYYFPSYYIGFVQVSDLVKTHGKTVLYELYTRESLKGIGEPPGVATDASNLPWS